MLHSSQSWTDANYEAVGQLENWTNLLVVSNAIRYGFAKDLHADPRKTLDVPSAESRMERIETEWTKEWRNRGDKEKEAPCPRFTSLPQDAKLFLDSVLVRSPLKDASYYDYPHY